MDNDIHYVIIFGYNSRYINYSLFIFNDTPKKKSVKVNIHVYVPHLSQREIVTVLNQITI